MQETTLGIPYLEYGDDPDIPLISKGIADAATLLTGQDRARLDTLTQQTGGDPSTSIIDPIIGLPTSPNDGQIAYVAAGAATRWTVQYDEATNLWILVGGNPLIVRIDGVATRTNTSDNGYTDPNTGTVGPQATPPLDGTYLYRLSARIDAAADGQEAAMGLKIGAAAVDDDAAITGYNDRYETVTGPLRSTGAITTADVLLCRYRNNGSAQPANFQNRVLEYIPQTLAAAS